jgi:hypothetical protein
MADDAMMAELYGMLLEGVKDGDERYLNRLYGKYEKGFPEEDETEQRLSSSLTRLLDELGEIIEGPLASRPHFVLLFAAMAHHVVGIPSGAVEDMPPRTQPILQNRDTAVANLLQLADLIETADPPESASAQEFWRASHAATVRAASRATRFLFFWRALLPEPLQL